MFYFDNPDFSLAIGNIILFVLFTIMVEVLFRIWRRINKNELAVIPSKPEMSVDDFKIRVFDK